MGRDAHKAEPGTSLEKIEEHNGEGQGHDFGCCWSLVGLVCRLSNQNPSLAAIGGISIDCVVNIYNLK